jgi:hypothetical protein
MMILSLSIVAGGMLAACVVCVLEALDAFRKSDRVSAGILLLSAFLAFQGMILAALAAGVRY